MQITDAKKTKRGKIAVSVDGEFLVSVDEFCWISSRLTIGEEVEPDTLNALLADSRRAEAKRRALNMLGQRSYTARQLGDRLCAKTDRAAADAAVARMQELGYLDDADTASRWAQELYGKGYALRRVRFELSRRGIDRETLDEALEFIDPDDEPTRAPEVLAAGIAPIETEKDRRRAAALLERYGYRAEAVSHALRSATTMKTEESLWDYMSE
ncbi:MAG: regulatory protein RecX [Oscillospiraceae bacterium]